MTLPIRTHLTYVVGIALAFSAGSAIAAGKAEVAPTDKVAVVVAGAAATDRDALAEARATGAEVRAVRTTAEQLGVMHALAARGYDTVITVGVDRRFAIAPVEEKYPRTRFVAAQAGGLGTAMSGA